MKWKLSRALRTAVLIGRSQFGSWVKAARSRNIRDQKAIHKRYSRIKYESRIAGRYFCQYRRIKQKAKKEGFNFRQIQTSKLEHCFYSYPVRTIWHGQSVGKDSFPAWAHVQIQGMAATNSGTQQAIPVPCPVSSFFVWATAWQQQPAPQSLARPCRHDPAETSYAYPDIRCKLQ